MSSIRTLLLSAPTLADLLIVHSHLATQCDLSGAAAKTQRRWHEATFYRVAHFIREAATRAEVEAIVSAIADDNYAAPVGWKDGLREVAQKRNEELEA